MITWTDFTTGDLTKNIFNVNSTFASPIKIQNTVDFILAYF
jgi:hypothetical protein